MNKASTYVRRRDDLKPKEAIIEAARKHAQFPKELPQFDHNKIALDSFILVIGKRRYGKSTWTQYVLSKMWHFFPRGGYCFTKTKHNYFWQQHLPASRIYDGFDEKKVREILDEQKDLWDMFLKGKEDPKENPPYVLLIFDDVIR